MIFLCFKLAAFYCEFEVQIESINRNLKKCIGVVTDVGNGRSPFYFVPFYVFDYLDNYGVLN